MIVACVECWYVVQVPAARFTEDVPILHGCLLQRLEAVSREARADDVESPESAAPQLGNRLVSIRLQPLCTPEA